jgi:hypothetical protein
MDSTAPATAGISSVTEKPVITRVSVIGMHTHSRTITLIIRTHIPIIGTGRTYRIKTTVGCLLTGVTLRLRTGVSCMERATPSTADITPVTEKPVIAESGIIAILTYTTYTGIIRADIKIITIRSIYTLYRPYHTRFRGHRQGGRGIILDINVLRSQISKFSQRCIRINGIIKPCNGTCARTNYTR